MLVSFYLGKVEYMPVAEIILLVASVGVLWAATIRLAYQTGQYKKTGKWPE